MQLLREAFTREPVRLDVEAEDVADLYEQLAAHVVELGLVPEEMRPRLVSALLAGESEAPTAIGSGVAIPHLYRDDLEQPALLFFRLARPLHMGALDGTATRFVFLMIGPSRSSLDHLDSLAAIARAMSDEEFHYDLEQARDSSDLLQALDHFERRDREGVSLPPHEDELARTGRLFGGVLRDVRRRLPSYASDFRDGLHPKTLSSLGFMFFACLAPAVTFGGVMAEQTGGAIGAAEMLTATAACGLLYAFLAGQPLIILGGTGPLLVITALLYQQCQSMGLPFLPVYAWVGLWSALILLALAATDASALMRWFTRFTDEIFAALISLIFIFESLGALQAVFVDESVPHDAALLTLVLALGTFYLGSTLGSFRSSRFLSPRLREFLADFGPTIAMALMTLVALELDEVDLSALAAPDEFGTTSGRPWLVPLFSVPWEVRLAALGPALLVSVLVFLDQNITARIINSPDHQLRKGGGYHLDLLLVGLLMGAASLFGLPWLVAATVRSLNHLHSLGTERGGRMVHVRETRLAPVLIHLLIAASLLALPLLKLIPMAVLYGLFLMMGLNSIHGNQFLDRVKLMLTDPDHYPPHHYIGRVRIPRIRLFTTIQAACLAVLWAVKVSPLGILFPVFIAAIVPLRLWLGRFFAPHELAELDAESIPDEAARPAAAPADARPSPSASTS